MHRAVRWADGGRGDLGIRTLTLSLARQAQRMGTRTACDADNTRRAGGTSEVLCAWPAEQRRSVGVCTFRAQQYRAAAAFVLC